MQDTILSRPDGTVVGVNQRARDFMPFMITPNAPNTNIVIPAGLGVGEFTMMVSGDGPASVCGLAAERDQACKVLLKQQEGRNIRPLMNGACHIDTIFGTGRTPYPMPQPLFIDELRRLTVTLTDLGTNTNNVRLNALSARATSSEADPTLAKARKRQDFRQFLEIPYWYTFDNGFIDLTGLTVFEQVITISPDHHFMLSQLSKISTAEFFIDIIDIAKGESLIYAPQGTHYGVSSKLLFGDGNYPYCFLEPVLFQVNQKILLRMSNQAAGVNTVFLTLGGVAVADRLWR
jgi:hypothetical protein